MNGRDLKQLRLISNVTQETVAKATGIPLSTIARWESKESDIVKAIQQEKLKTFFKKHAAAKVKLTEEDFKLSDGEFYDKLLKENKIILGVDYGEPVENFSQFEEIKYQPGNEAVLVSHESVGVPYYNLDFATKFDTIFNDESVRADFHIDCKPFNDVNWWVNISGHSMDDIIGNNDMVALKRVDDWEGFLLMDEIYAIQTSNNFRTIRRVSAGTDKDHFNLVPQNRLFSQQEIPKKMITDVFRVKGCIKKFF